MSTKESVHISDNAIRRILFSQKNFWTNYINSPVKFHTKTPYVTRHCESKQLRNVPSFLKAENQLKNNNNNFHPYGSYGSNNAWEYFMGWNNFSGQVWQILVRFLKMKLIMFLSIPDCISLCGLFIFGSTWQCVGLFQLLKQLKVLLRGLHAPWLWELHLQNDNHNLFSYASLPKGWNGENQTICRVFSQENTWIVFTSISLRCT